MTLLAGSPWAKIVSPAAHLVRLVRTPVHSMTPVASGEAGLGAAGFLLVMWTHRVTVAAVSVA